MIAVVIAALAFLPMVGEAIVSARNDRELRRQGAIEPKDDVIRIMQLAYPGSFLFIVVEAWLRQVPLDGIFVTGLAVFAVAKALKYWAIATLGERWTFRVLVPPGSARIISGPYRLLRHPNYAAVMGEFAGATLMAHAWVSGPIGALGFFLLIVARIRVEERALGMTIQSRS